MVGRARSIAFEDLRKYWGQVDFVKPPKIAKLKRYDLIIGQEPTLRIGLFSYILSRLSGAKLVFEVHADYLEFGLSPFQKKIAEYLLKKCDAVRAVSKKIMQDLQKIGVKNIMMIPSIYIKTDMYRQLTPHSHRRPVILSIGRLVEQKNFPPLLYAFKEVVKEVPEAKLIIHGRGPLEREIVELAKKINISSKLKLFTNWISEEDLVSLYDMASILAITSRYEGGPRVAFEAGACCTPFVSTRVGILHEVVPNGVGGLYTSEDPYEIADKMLILLHDAGVRQKMGENMRKIVLENFEWHTAIKKYAEAYLNLFLSCSK